MKTILEQFREKQENGDFGYPHLDADRIENFLTTIKDQMLECCGENKVWPFKISKKTGELDFGKYPSSTCRSCGQKRQSELQGYNQAKKEIREAVISKFGG